MRSVKPCLFTVPLIPWLCTLDRLFRVREGCHLVEGPSVATDKQGAVANQERK